MVIKIQKLTMLNFKGVLGERTINFNPNITQVLGANKTGKTTIADAFRWCLFGKNSEGKSVFGIKTKDAQGNVIPELSHEVSVLLTVDGREVELRRVYVEKWSKPRKQDIKELAGHTTNYYVNGDKYTEKEYKEYIDSICTESLFVCITNPTYFTSLEDDKQRSLLTKMVGNVSVETIAEGNEGFMQLLAEIDGTDVEKYLQHLSYKKKDIKDELERIPVRIQEQQTELAQLTADAVDWKQLEGDVKATEEAIERIDEEMQDRSKVVDTEQRKRMDARNVIAQLKDEAQKREQAHRLRYSREINDHNMFTIKLQGALDGIEAEKAEISKKIERAKTKLADMEEVKDDFRKRWAETNNMQLAIDEDEFICPTCKRRFEDGDIERKIEELQAAFNTRKASMLQALNEEAQHIKSEQENYSKDIEQYEAELAKLDVKATELKQEIEKAKAVSIMSSDDTIATDEQLASIREEIAKRTTELEALESEQPATADTSSLKADKAQLQAKRDALRDKLNTRTIIANKQKRVAELEQQEKQLNTQLAELEGKEDTATQMVQATIEALEQRVNALFSFVQFTMFDHKINGALKPKCECTVGGVPYADLNNADRINAGIDIINAICAYNNVFAPCFIDNAESINNVMPMQSQCVQLIVSRDRELVIINE